MGHKDKLDIYTVYIAVYVNRHLLDFSNANCEKSSLYSPSNCDHICNSTFLSYYIFFIQIAKGMIHCSFSSGSLELLKLQSYKVVIAEVNLYSDCIDINTLKN